jgi:hypothetical protein
LQFFPNQAQFANDLLRDLVFQDFTSLSRNTIAFTAGSSIVLVAPVVRNNCVRERIRANATLLHCDLLTGRGREGKLALSKISKCLSGGKGIIFPLQFMGNAIPQPDHEGKTVGGTG